MACVRVVIGLLFLSAAVMKAYDAPGFRTVVGDLLTAWWPGERGLPEPVRYPGVAIATTLVITWEAVVGAALLIPGLTRSGLRLALTTLVFFTLILIAMLFLSDPPSCGCLGGAGTSSSNARTGIFLGVVRNLALVAMSLWALRRIADLAQIDPSPKASPEWV